MVRKALTDGLLILAVLFTGSCGSAVKLPPAQEASSAELTWPAAPLRPRIRFVKAVERPEDLGIRPSFWRKVGDFLAGKGEERFVRPTSVAAHGPVVYVTDPGAGAVWIFDLAAGRSRTIHGAGEQPLISPVAVALGREQRAYVADSRLARVFVYNSDGDLAATIADPRFQSPAGLAYDAGRDRLYVADSAAHRVWTLDGNGTPLGAIGRRGTGDGEFNFPTHVSVDKAGTIYVMDALNFRLQIFSAEEKFIGQFGRHGDTSGDFGMPKGVAVDSEGHIYVVEALFDAVQIFDQHGNYLLSFGEHGTGPGQFWLPSGTFIDGGDRIYVADAYNRRIQVFRYLAGGTDE